MSDQHRSLPNRPNLRYLKIEAKRRLAAGEFPTLHAAQLAVAREHGQSSWTALKRVVESGPQPGRHAREQLRWLVTRFGDAGSTTWTAPGDDELRGHFHEQFLGALPPERLLPMLTALTPRLREALRDRPVLAEDTPTHALVQLDAGQLQAVVEPDAPHRLVGLRVYRAGAAAGPRPGSPADHTLGDVPEAATDVAARAFAELGLVGLALAGGDSPESVWALARGWADLDPARRLTTRHRFPVCATAQLVIATAVLRTAAEGRIRLDDPANRHLGTLRLTDPAVTVRELLSHTGGVDGPAEPSGPQVPSGPVVPCGSVRGRFAYGDTGYAVLGQLLADVTGAPCPEAVARLVLEPLGMSHSSFTVHRPGSGPGSDPDPDPDPDPGSGSGSGDVTGYDLAADRGLEPVPRVGGLWSTAADLARFGLTWHTLLPDELAREALGPQADVPGGSRIGLGWHLDRTGEIAGHPGSAPGAAASLVLRLRDHRVHVALTNRRIPVEPVNGRILRALG